MKTFSLATAAATAILALSSIAAVAQDRNGGDRNRTTPTFNSHDQ
jgi:hypothetical protein